MLTEYLTNLLLLLSSLHYSAASTSSKDLKGSAQAHPPPPWGSPCPPQSWGWPMVPPAAAVDAVVVAPVLQSWLICRPWPL